MDTMVKVCGKCKQEKPVTEFHRSTREGYQGRCKACVLEYWSMPEHKKQKREWAVRNEHRVKHFGFMRRFKMPMSEYEDRLARQGGKCASCRRKAGVLQVDHDHKCCPGKVTCGKCTRDLLCKDCNNALGFFRDDPQMLLKAVRYLRKWERIRSQSAEELSTA